MNGELDHLMNEAREAAQNRGHTLGPFAPGEFWRERRYADCTECGMGVAVDPDPPPNGIDISGSAVALNCTGKEKS